MSKHYAKEVTIAFDSKDAGLVRSDTVTLTGVYDPSLLPPLPKPQVGQNLCLHGLPSDLMDKVATDGWARYGGIALRLSLVGREVARANSVTFLIEEIAEQLPAGEKPIFTVDAENMADEAED